jgi:sugar lactone lactonase YvrE
MAIPRSFFCRLLLVACVIGWAGQVARAADMQYPIDIAVDGQGTIYIADRNLPGIWQIKDGKRSIYFEGSKKFRTPLNAIRCLIVDAKGQLIAGDSSTREVYRFDADKKPVPLTKGGVGIPMALALNKAGDLYIADIETQRIFKQPAAGGELVEFAQVTAPRGLIFDTEDRLLVISSSGKNPVLRFTPDGKSETLTSGEPLVFPHHLVLDKEQNVYVADGYAKTIWKIGADKKPVKFVGGDPLSNPVGLAWLGDKLLVADPRSKDFVYSVESEKLVPVPGAK